MSYAFQLCTYILIASFVTAVVADLLAPLGMTATVPFAATMPYVVIVVGRLVLRRKISDTMARYLARACPHCNGYVGITIREPGRNVPLQAVNGRCTQCTFRMAWIVIEGRGTERALSSKRFRIATDTSPGSKT
jgi:hypothetical protein